MSQFVITRARAITNEVFYAAGMKDEDEATEPFTRVYQYHTGVWDARDVFVRTQRIALYHRPEGGRIAVYMTPDGMLFSPEPSFERAEITDEALKQEKKLGRLSDLRQVDGRFLACGDGGQTYSFKEGKGWLPLDIELFDQEVDVEWAFAIQAPGATIGQQNEYWRAHPDEKSERDRRIEIFSQSLSLHAINGLNENHLYYCGADGAVYFWNGERSRKIETPTSAFLLDIDVEDEDNIFICGRDGTLLRGNHRDGFKLVSCRGRPNFSTITRFRNKLYLSSYSNPRGLFVYDGAISQVSGELVLNDVHTVDAAEDVLWVFGSKKITRFDGTRWEPIEIPATTE